MSPGPTEVLPGGALVVPSAFVCSVTLVLSRLVTMVEAAAASIVRSVGSTSHRPVLPAGAEVSTWMPVKSTLAPEVSTTPPLPPLGPPLASIRPATAVCAASIVTLPPLPLTWALAVILAPASIAAVFAVRLDVAPTPPLARASVVPSATVPPPALPDALTRAPAATVTALVAFASISPPVVPSARPLAETLPLTRTEPPMPLSTIVPVLVPTLLAEILPPADTRLSTIPSTACAVRITVPPSAMIVPLLVTRAETGLPSGPAETCCTCLVTLIDSMPSPYRSTVCASAPASTTRPILARIAPLLATWGATSAARPCS